MKMKILLFMIFLNFAVYSSEIITWYKVPMAPFFISEGTDKDKGVHDLMLNFYKNSLNSYTNTVELVSLNRLLELAKKFDENTKFVSMILLKSPEREKFLYFSRPYDYILSNHLIIKKENLKLFESYIDESGFFNLEEALKNDKIKFGLGAGRFYHKNINSLTEKAKNIDITLGLENQESILKKLIANRINATIDYPESMQYILKSNNLSLDFVAIPIKGVDPYNFLRLSFPKNSWGLMMLEKFNPIIEAYTKTKEFEKLSLKWSPDKIKYLKTFRENSF